MFSKGFKGMREGERSSKRTQFQVFFRAGKELGDARCEAFCKNIEFAAERMLTEEEAEDLD